MKKTALLAVAAVVFAACGHKCNEVEVGALISSSKTYADQTVTFVGKAIVQDAGKFAVYGADSTAGIFVTADETLFSAVECGKSVKVTGVVTACEQEAGKYYVVATEIEKASCCKKSGEKEKCKAEKEKCKAEKEKCKEEKEKCKEEKKEKKCCKKDTLAVEE
jgi:RPA family protein